MKCILINNGRGRGGYLMRGDGGEMVVLLPLGTVLYCSHMLYQSCAISKMLCVLNNILLGSQND